MPKHTGITSKPNVKTVIHLAGHGTMFQAYQVESAMKCQGNSLADLEEWRETVATAIQGGTTDLSDLAMKWVAVA